MRYFGLFVTVIFLSMIASATGEERPRRHLPHPQSADSRTYRTLDCSAYTSVRTYFECVVFGHSDRQRLLHRRSLVAAAKPKAAPAPVSQPARQEAPIKPTLSLQKPSALINVALDPRFAARRSSCVTGMDRCYEGCKIEGGRPEFCNSACRTDHICSAPLALNYGQFLDFQVEMLALPGHSQPKVALLARLAPQLSH